MKNKTHRCSFRLCYLVAVLGFLLFPQCTSPSEYEFSLNYPAAERKVFAHYMVCCPTAGGEAGIEDFKKEILEAQKRGIDGFALNCGGWQQLEPHYKRRALQIYEAAHQLKSGFQLFISIDGAAFNEVDDIITSVRDHPNQFCYDGKPVISTFGGEGSDNVAGRNLINQVHSLGAVLVPFFYPRPDITEHPKKQHAKQLLSTFPELEGYFYFGAAGTGEQIVNSSSILAKEYVGAGKIFMAGITPYYRGNETNFRLFETRGFESMALEWETAINNGTTWVELVTWNDWNESTYLAPFGAPADTALWKGHFGPKMLSHVAYLDASRYYIEWFKSGSPPPITRDELHYFYRLHSKNAKAIITPQTGENSMGFPDGARTLKDDVFVTLFLTGPAQLKITSGNRNQSYKLKAGIHHVSMPFSPGKQRFTLSRNGHLILDKIGEHQITSDDTGSRFNYFAGSAFSPHAD